MLDVCLHITNNFLYYFWFYVAYIMYNVRTFILGVVWHYNWMVIEYPFVGFPMTVVLSVSLFAFCVRYERLRQVLLFVVLWYARGFLYF